jgi:hypothetical protein
MFILLVFSYLLLLLKGVIPSQVYSNEYTGTISGLIEKKEDNEQNWYVSYKIPGECYKYYFVFEEMLLRTSVLRIYDDPLESENSYLFTCIDCQTDVGLLVGARSR